MTSEKPKITYVRGRGKAEIARLIFAVKDVETTEEHVVTKEDFQKLKSTGKLMFQQLPLIEVDGLCVIESAAQANYLGLKYDMLGGTNHEKAMVQMLYHGAVSFTSASSSALWEFGPPEKTEETQKMAINKARLRYLPVFDKVFAENGTGFLVGNSPTIADCALFDILCLFKEVPVYGNLLDEAPNCKAFVEKFSGLEGVSKYLKSPRRFPPPDAAYVKEVKAALYSHELANLVI